MKVDASELITRRCKPCEGGAPPLEASVAEQLLPALHNDWAIAADGKSMARMFKFANYQQTISFVNAVAWIAEKEDHHPDLTVTYGKVEILYTTHAVGGLSENDFICAAKIDHL